MKLRIGDDPAISVAWQIAAAKYMVDTALHQPDPHLVMMDWFDQAAEGDQAQLRWALATWHVIQQKTVFDLEVIRHQINVVQQALF